MPTTNMDGVEIPVHTEWLTLKQAALYAQTSYPRFSQAVKNGELPAYRIPGSTSRGARVKKSDVDTGIEGCPY